MDSFFSYSVFAPYETLASLVPQGERFQECSAKLKNITWN